MLRQYRKSLKYNLLISNQAPVFPTEAPLWSKCSKVQADVNKWLLVGGWLIESFTIFSAFHFDGSLLIRFCSFFKQLTTCIKYLMFATGSLNTKMNTTLLCFGVCKASWQELVIHTKKLQCTAFYAVWRRWNERRMCFILLEEISY